MAQESKEDRYSRWKSLIPVLYDWLTNHNLMWPSLSCRWGPLLEQGVYKNHQRLYISEQTIEKYPNTLVVANCEVVKPRVAAAEHISQFNEEAKSPFVKKHKTIIHPGEVNRIREMPQNSKIVATHTDSSEVLIWNVETQPNRTAHVGAAISKPDLILTGHADNAEYALALSSTAPFILSGGKDKQVLLWSIEDHVPEFREPSPLKPATPGGKPRLGGFHLPASDPTKIGPRGQFRGHSMTVEDVQFRPFSTQEFCSVGDDACLILWDARIGSQPAVKVESAHESDVHCVDWNTHDDNYILTGSADMSVRLFDRRKLSAENDIGAPVEIFEGHTAAVLCVQWCPDGKSIFGSSADDGILNVWDFEKVTQAKQEGKGAKKRAQHAPPGLFFQHAGHRYKVVDFHWDPVDPWTIVSVSDDCEGASGGGTLQIWRMNDLIYRPEKEVLEELEKYRDQILGGRSLNS